MFSLIVNKIHPNSLKKYLPKIGKIFSKNLMGEFRRFFQYFLKIFFTNGSSNFELETEPKFP